MNKIDSKRLIQYVDIIKEGFKNKIELGLYCYSYMDDSGCKVKKLFISQINMQDDMYYSGFKAKRILDKCDIMYLTSENHINNTYCKCGSNSHDMLEMLFNGDEEKPCTCTFQYEEMGLEQLQIHIDEQIND